MTTPILYESHMHTPLCKHAWGQPGDYAAQAQRKGLQGIIVTCHCPLPDGLSSNVRMGPEQFDDYVALVARTRAEWAGRVDVRLGLESDYIPEFTGWLTALHQRADFHYILGSIHSQLEYYRERFPLTDPRDRISLYYEHLAQAAESGLFDALAHPDLIKNEHPDQWQPDQLMEIIRPALDRIAATGVAMEINTSGLHKRVREMNPGPAILAEMAIRRIPVVLGADAHSAQRVAANYSDALDLLQTAGYSQISYFLHRQRVDVAMDAARASLSQPQPIFV